MKTLIAIPCMDQVPAQFCESLATLRRVGECQVAFHMGSLIYTARNTLAETAIQMDADWMLWLDSDMVFRPDLLEVLYNTAQEQKADFVTGVYYRRREPYSPVLFKTLSYSGDVPTWSNQDEIPDHPFEVEGCGFGAVLLNTQVLFDVLGKYGANPFTPTANLGEDLAFCWRARECGYKIIADPSAPLGHIGYTMITKAHWKAFEDQERQALLDFGSGK